MTQWHVNSMISWLENSSGITIAPIEHIIVLSDNGFIYLHVFIEIILKRSILFFSMRFSISSFFAFLAKDYKNNQSFTRLVIEGGWKLNNKKRRISRFFKVECYILAIYLCISRIFLVNI